jgi:nucleotide-binding universal stress UspA family protein
MPRDQWHYSPATGDRRLDSGRITGLDLTFHRSRRLAISLLEVVVHGEIFVGVDRSAPSRAALRWALERARSTSSGLTIVHVVDPVLWASAAASHDEVMDEAWSFVRGESEFARALDGGINISFDVAEGDPAEELASASKDAGMVVVGTHKTGFVHGKVYGSKFLNLASSAAYASAFIPEPSGSTRTGIVVGIDESDVGVELIRFAASEAARTSQELTLIGSSDQVDFGAPPDGRRSPLNRHDYTARLCWAISVARTTDPMLSIRGRNSNHPAAESLVRAAVGANVLVVGSAPRHSGHLAALGTVALDVLLNIPSPVIVLRTHSTPVAALDEPQLTSQRFPE